MSDSTSSVLVNGTDSARLNGCTDGPILDTTRHDELVLSNSQEELCDGDLEEKQRLISQILELQHTLEDLSARVDAVKIENLKLRSENQILGQYIENMMANSSVFQSTSPHSSSIDKRRAVTSHRNM